MKKPSDIAIWLCESWPIHTLKVHYDMTGVDSAAVRWIPNPVEVAERRWPVLRLRWLPAWHCALDIRPHAPASIPAPTAAQCLGALAKPGHSFLNMTHQEFKKELCAMVTRDIESIKRQLFGPSKRIARKSRRARQPWLKRLKTGE